LNGRLLLASLGLFGAAGAAAYYYFEVYNANVDYSDDGTPLDDSPISGLDSVTDNAEALVTGWKAVGEAAAWLPTLADVEQNYGLPVDLLARIAYEESHFREEIIRGTKASPAGAMGIMQLEPKFYPSAAVAVPFSDDDVSQQIDDAGSAMADHYNRFGSWTLALAAYNAGEGNVSKYGGIPPFSETQKYVSDISADVPGLA
jgi:soluble lytic murein transglycosylase-like protein